MTGIIADMLNCILWLLYNDILHHSLEEINQNEFSNILNIS